MPADPVAEAEAALAVVKLEQRLLQLKTDDNADPDELRQVKHDLREARRVHRSDRVGLEGISAETDATAHPEALKASASVRDN